MLISSFGSIRKSLMTTIRFAAAVLSVCGCQEKQAVLQQSAANPAPPNNSARPELFPEKVTLSLAERPVTLQLTGQATRKAMYVAIYRIASYCDEKKSYHDVDELAAADISKQLQLAMERDISSESLTRGFEEGFARNDPSAKYEDEKRVMLDYFRQSPLKKGDRILITHLPASGVSIQVGDKTAVEIRDLGFAHVVWKMYMGPRGLGEHVRRGLGERLKANSSERAD